VPDPAHNQSPHQPDRQPGQLPDSPETAAQGPTSTVITSANTASDVPQIIYGLSIRGVRAHVLESADRHTDRYLIVLDDPTPIRLKIAQDSLASIWDAILDEYPRAVTLNGHCYFCQYDVTTLARPTTCPECGNNLDSHQARRAMRDGKGRIGRGLGQKPL
tara:strand:+ start:18394 stop:18876 length:483 start_codon:yes stop_codon:yes gene_type:complete